MKCWCAEVFSDHLGELTEASIESNPFSCDLDVVIINSDGTSVRVLSPKISILEKTINISGYKYSGVDTNHVVRYTHVVYSVSFSKPQEQQEQQEPSEPKAEGA